MTDARAAKTSMIGAARALVPLGVAVAGGGVLTLARASREWLPYDLDSGLATGWWLVAAASALVVLLAGRSGWSAGSDGLRVVAASTCLGVLVAVLLGGPIGVPVGLVLGALVAGPAVAWRWGGPLRGVAVVGVAVAVPALGLADAWLRSNLSRSFDVGDVVLVPMAVTAIAVLVLTAGAVVAPTSARTGEAAGVASVGLLAWAALAVQGQEASSSVSRTPTGGYLDDLVGHDDAVPQAVLSLAILLLLAVTALAAVRGARIAPFVVTSVVGLGVVPLWLDYLAGFLVLGPPQPTIATSAGLVLAPTGAVLVVVGQVARSRLDLRRRDTEVVPTSAAVARP